MAPAGAVVLFFHSITIVLKSSPPFPMELTEPSDPESAVAKELSILSASSLLKWKKNAVGPIMLGCKVRIMRSLSLHLYNILIFRETRERKKAQKKKIQKKNLTSL